MPCIHHRKRVQQLGNLGALKLRQVWGDCINYVVKVRPREEPQLRKGVAHLRELPGHELPQVLEGEAAETPKEEASRQADARGDRQRVHDVPGREAVHLVRHALDDEVYELLVEDAPAPEGLQQEHTLRWLKVVHELHRLSTDELNCGRVANTTHGQCHCHRSKIPWAERVLPPNRYLRQPLGQVRELRGRTAEPRSSIRYHGERADVHVIETRRKCAEDRVEAPVAYDLLVIGVFH
mmetsp:Transcript_79578/g.233989  ORF Transcript_79578/g.233989 Transcript_79578/m.233989 type:complete len:237 (+) Transcript_79578:666-1376(+)